MRSCSKRPVELSHNSFCTLRRPQSIRLRTIQRKKVVSVRVFDMATTTTATMLLRRTVFSASSHRSGRRISGRRAFAGVPVSRSAEENSPLASDGRHEIWREGQSSDHDNEPRYARIPADTNCSCERVCWHDLAVGVRWLALPSIY
jgi:hypothetical protein